MESVPQSTATISRKFNTLENNWMLELFMEIDGDLPLGFHTPQGKEVERGFLFPDTVIPMWSSQNLSKDISYDKYSIYFVFLFHKTNILILNNAFIINLFSEKLKSYL